VCLPADHCSNCCLEMRRYCCSGMKPTSSKTEMNSRPTKNPSYRFRRHRPKSPGSKLDVFPRVDLNAEVDRALVDVDGSTVGMYR